MRGKGKWRGKRAEQSRITPAYAGKSLFLTRRGFSKWDHPRVCGEKGDLVPIYLDEVGSPPRMRGKDRPPDTIGSHVGDHPRVCGEKMHPKTSDSLISGSPPRMRGKAIDRHFPEPCFGITPAYAGKRGRNKSGQPAAKDHPRVCGEKADTAAACALCWGSPPRMRGKAPSAAQAALQMGITPAYAGKSFTVEKCRVSNKDHPRVCGEKTKKIP